MAIEEGVRIVTDFTSYEDIPHRSEAEKTQDTILATALEHAQAAESAAILAVEWLEVIKPATRNTVAQVHQLVMEIEELQRIR